MKSNLKWLGLIVFLTPLSCSKAPPPTEKILRPVRTEQVYSTGDRVRTFSGVAQSGVESKISFKVDGTIANVPVEVGRRVQAGDIIAEIDAEDYELQVQDAAASLAQSEAQKRNAAASYERVRGLYESRNASKQDLDAARAQYESAEASVESIKKKLELARNQLGYTKLTAPIAGSVAAVEVEVNENVRAGQTVVLLTSGSDMEVRVAIPELLISRIREGDPVTVTFDAMGDRNIPGRVTEVGVAATEIGTTYPVTVRLERTDDDVRSGMAAEVAFRFASRSGVERIRIPLVALGEDREGRFVFVVEPGSEPGVGIVRRRNVAVGDLRADGIELLSGLADGEYVVTAGVSLLEDGQEVKFDATGGSGP